MKENINFKKELDFILSTKIFFKEPSNNRVLLFACWYIFFSILGSFLGVYFITSIFSLPLLVFILAARGKNYYIPLIILSIFTLYITSSITAVVWNLIHVLLGVVIFKSIKYRYPKLLILILISSFIFLGLTLYLHILFSTGIVNYSPQGIQNYLNSYLIEISSLQPNTDIEIYREAFEQLKRYLPTILFLGIITYSLVLINYTFYILAKEKAITPVFPKLKLVAVGRNVAYMYLLLTLILILIVMEGLDLYNPFYLFFFNVYSIFRWIFVFNGICTVFFFIEDKAKSANGFLKFLTVLSAYLFSSLFDIIGLVDSLVRLREAYVRMKGDE